MQITTTRTTLCLINWSDLDAIHELHALPETDRFNALGIPENTAVTKQVIAPWIAENQLPIIKNYTFAIENKIDGAFIGLLGFKLGSEKYKRGEVWYKIHPDHWGNGYATEVLIAIINFGFATLKLHRIEAGCAVENVGSIKVLEKAGMQREGRHRKILPLKSGWSDSFAYAILESDEWLQKEE
ncbi:MAG: GNAT family N-acetyltransferase [Saprospiraceae bacterium]